MVIRTTFSRGNVGPSFKGRAYSYLNEKGEITASWPSAPGKARSELQAFNMELFRQACIAMKLMHPDFIKYAAENAKGKPFLPRDSLMAMLYGKGPVIHFNNGKTIRSMATRVDMSSVMDNIAWRKHSMLVRYEDLWEGLDPPTEYSILVFDPIEGPYWAEPEPQTGAPIWLIPYGTNVTALNKNLKGNVWNLWADIVIDMLQCKHSLTAGTQLKWLVARLDGAGAIDQVIVDDNHPVTAPGGTTTFVYALPSELTLPLGHRYFVGVYVPAAATTFNTPLFNGALMASQLSVAQDQARYAEATITPAVGTVPDFDSSNSLYCVGWRGR